MAKNPAAVLASNIPLGRNGKPRKPSKCRDCGVEFFAGKGRRYCDDCRKVVASNNEYVLKSQYKITFAELARLREITACEVCGAEGDMVIDHNHETGKVRGRICRSCNFALGHVKDNVEILRGLALYLEDRDGTRP